MAKSRPATQLVVELGRHVVEDGFGGTGFVVIGPAPDEGIELTNQPGLGATAILTDDMFELGQMAFLSLLTGSDQGLEIDWTLAEEGGGVGLGGDSERVVERRKVVMAKLKLDLHDIYNRGQEIEAELNRIVQEAIDRKIERVEIIPGKGSGQLKKKVLRFLNQGHIKKLYHRVEKDDKNFGRIFIHFRF
jgi:hypothetical protein